MNARSQLTKLGPTRSPLAWACLGAFGISISCAAADETKLRTYGKHLAQECTSCHRLDGTDTGIPSIAGWPADTFVATMKYYREGSRTNPVMVSVANSLSERQLNALAAYLASLPKPARRDGAKK
jgi:cytochrome c553